MTENQNTSQQTDNTTETTKIDSNVSQADITALAKQVQILQKQNQELNSKLSTNQLVKEEPEAEKLTLKKMQEKFERMEAEKQSETQKRRDMEMRSNAKEVLLEKGVQPEMVKAAMAMLVDADKQIRYNDDGELKFYDSVTGFEYDLKDGIEKWSKSADAKGFLAGKNVIGGGSKSPRTVRNTQKMNKMDWEQMLAEQAIQFIREKKF